MLTKLNSAAIIGLSVHQVELELDASPGLPAWELVGLPDTTVRESKERVRTAIKNSDYEFPSRKIVVNLAPAHLRKEGAALDLALAVAILTATDQLHVRKLDKYLFVAELGLDGSLRPVKGILPISREFCHSGMAMIVAEENKNESAIGGCPTYAFHSLRQVMNFLEHPGSSVPYAMNTEDILVQMEQNSVHPKHDFADIKGQSEAKRALEIAAAGNHNILMIGSPGAGKTMLSEALPGILPPITYEESLEVSTIYSIAGMLSSEEPLFFHRPFRAPHHRVSASGLIGGGRIPRPGEISLAHQGVLFLDEFPEFSREVLEALRQPLEEGNVTISRLQAQITFPCRFLLVASMNPCPCGYASDPNRPCTCSPGQIHRYRSKLSGPLLDRFDLQIEIQPVCFQDLYEAEPAESSADIALRVKEARNLQQKRFAGTATHNNSEMTSRQMQEFCKLDPAAQKFLEQAFHKLGFSARAHSRVLKVARTIADLSGSREIQIQHLAEAVQYRTTDKRIWLDVNQLPM